mgnify:CR=1 FL=1
MVEEISISLIKEEEVEDVEDIYNQTSILTKKPNVLLSWAILYAMIRLSSRRLSDIIVMESAIYRCIQKTTTAKR